jgi:hypothetical protein
VCEAIASGCFPLLPAKLSYPELLPGNMLEQCLYASEDELVQKLEAKLLEFPFAVDQGLQKKVLKFDWRVQAPVYDKIFEDLVRKNTLEKEA